MSLSIIIPTYNRVSTLRFVVEALEQQTVAKDFFEVIVVSDGSTDGTDKYLREVETSLQLHPVFQKNSGPASARNRGVAKARNELVLFLDDDVVPTPNLVSEHLAAHRQYEDQDVVIIGPMLTPEDFPLSPWVRWMQNRLAEQYYSMKTGEWEATARQFYTGNASMKRQAFLEHGGFDVSFLRAEDVELAFRLAESGIKFIFCPLAVGYHYEQRSFSSWLKIPYSYGRNDVVFAQEKGQNWLLKRIYDEYDLRNIFIKALTRFSLDHDRLTALVTRLMKLLLDSGARFRLPIASRVACSSLFNLYYYQGVADKLGGRQQFFSGGVLNDRV